MTIAQSDGESSKSGIEGQQIKQTHHLIKLPAPHHSHFVVSVLHLTDSYFVWCGETPHGAAAEEEAREFRTRSQMTSSPLPQQQASALSAEEEAALATLTEEERRQIEVDRRMDEELANALQAAGRQEAQQTAAMPKGFLAREWAVAMQRPSRSSVSVCLAAPRRVELSSGPRYHIDPPRLRTSGTDRNVHLPYVG